MTGDPMALYPIGPDLYSRNRRLVAERSGWPADAAEICERLEKQFPGWTVSWFDENRVRGFEYAAGFYAWPAGTPAGCSLYVDGMQRWFPRVEVYGPDANAAKRWLSSPPAAGITYPIG